jgi:hypothetical protein
MTTWITALILVWFIFRDWPKVLMNFVELKQVIDDARDERYWRKHMSK